MADCGCCDPANTDDPMLCPVGKRLRAATAEAWRAYEEAGAGGAIAHAWLHYQNAREAWREHFGAAG